MTTREQHYTHPEQCDCDWCRLRRYERQVLVSISHANRHGGHVGGCTNPDCRTGKETR